MKNTMEIDGIKTVIEFDPELNLLRGEFIGLNGGADFYASDLETLRKEGEQSLALHRQVCEENGLPLQKSYSGKFNVRISPELHADLVTIAAAQQQSLNQLVESALKETVATR